MPQGAKPTQEKKQTVTQFTNLINDYPVVAVVDLQNLPARQLMDIRSQIRDKALVKMTKKSLIKRALKESNKEGIEDLSHHLKGMPALLFTEENPFSIYKELQESKSPAPIKAGQEAPKDITVEEGPTDFAPGPIIGELGGLGIDAGIDGGKVTIQEDTVVAEEGDVVGQDLASILNRLEIYPMEIGLRITAAYEAGSILEESDLDINTDEIFDEFKQAHSDAYKLSVGANIYTKENITEFIQRSYTDSFKLAYEQHIINAETVKDVIGDAQAKAYKLQEQVSD